MLQIKYKGVFLDIQPGQTAEITRNSPLFMIDQITAEYSTPFILASTEKNSVALGHIFFDTTIKSKIKIQVELWDMGSNGTNYIGPAVLVVESSAMNRDFTGKGNASGYLLTGISDFFTLIKDQLLTSLAFGGDRLFTYTSSNADDGSNGYIQHFKSTWLFNDDYVGVPCRDEMFDGTDAAGSQSFMNYWAWQGGANPFFVKNVVVFPKLSYVISQIFKENNWQADFSGLAGTHWDKLVLFNAYSVDCGFYTTGFGGIESITQYSIITINVSKTMPQGITVSNFITELCKRYGWAPIADANTRVCRFIALKNVMNGSSVKNWTPYSASSALSNYTSDPKVYNFKNSFGGEDELPSSADFTGYKIATPVASFASLPTASPIYDNSVIYCLLENSWYKIAINDTTNDRYWEWFADNIYDEEVTNSNTDISTAVTTLPTYRTSFIASSQGLFPACKQSRFKKWGIRTLLYLGIVNAVDADGNVVAIQYPFASSCNLDNTGTKVLPWANVYRHKLNNSDDGIIQYWWQPWLNAVQSAEEVKRRYYLPIHELLQYKWDDIIVDNGVPYLLKSYVTSLNYAGYIEATMQRLVYSAIKVTDETTGEIIYFHLAIENIESVPDYTSWGTNFTNVLQGDLVLYCWADADGTIPFTPTAKKVTLQWVQNVNGSDFPYQQQILTTSDHRYVDAVKWQTQYDAAFPGVFSNHVLFTYSIIAGTGYGVI